MHPSIDFNRLTSHKPPLHVPDHFLAFRICGYLRIKPSKVLIHWACAKVRASDPDEESDEQLAEAIHAKMSQVPQISYAAVAQAAFQRGRTNLVTLVTLAYTHAYTHAYALRHTRSQPHRLHLYIDRLVYSYHRRSFLTLSLAPLTKCLSSSKWVRRKWH
jgi:hypothetical protein